MTSLTSDSILQALGLKPKAAPKQLKQPSLEKHEVDKLLKGAAAEGEEEGAAVAEADRIKGLGFASGYVMYHCSLFLCLPLRACSNR